MNNAFQWVPFYEALADKLLTYQNKRSELFKLIKKVSSEQAHMKYLNFGREDWWADRKHQIDPFSVIGVLNCGKMTFDNRTRLANILGNTFGLNMPAPAQFDGIPVLNPLNSFFAGVDEVWALFIAAMKVAETDNFTEEFKSAFENALAVKGNGLASVTMGLFWIRPNMFMPLDNRSRAFISTMYDINPPSEPCSGDEYIAFLAALKNKIAKLFPNITLPELSYNAWNESESITSEQQQRTAFKQWYVENVGKSNSASTISTAIGKAKLKNGSSIFSISTFVVLDTAIKNSGLSEYFQIRDGDYSKMDAAFIIDESAQRDDLKSGIKYYLSFLKSQDPKNGEPHKNLKIISKETKETSLPEVNLPKTIFNKNIILYGPPGTGKTYTSIQYAVAIIEDKPLDIIKNENYDKIFSSYLKYKDNGLVNFITFHQSFGYEEFIEGIRPVLSSEENIETGRDIEYEIRDGIFKAFCNKAGTPIENEMQAKTAPLTQEVKNSNRVFIIDEINRGNISKIFGELITLIESSKRIGTKEPLRTTLPYSGQSFGVPDNVYIVGTMNTSDRSLTHIDTALRRRFSFVSISPDAEILPTKAIGRINLVRLLIVINKRITFLYDKEHCIGHSYFCAVKTLNDLADVFKNNIIPLLEEYFFDESEKIRLVLGNAPFFIEETMDSFLREYGKDYRNTSQWILNDEALQKEETYIKIYDNANPSESSGAEM